MNNEAYKLEMFGLQLAGLSVWMPGGKVPCTEMNLGDEVWVEWTDKRFVKFWIDGNKVGKSDKEATGALSAVFDWCPIRKQYAAVGILDNSGIAKAEF